MLIYNETSVLESIRGLRKLAGVVQSKCLAWAGCFGKASFHLLALSAGFICTVCELGARKVLEAQGRHCVCSVLCSQLVHAAQLDPMVWGQEGAKLALSTARGQDVFIHSLLL